MKKKYFIQDTDNNFFSGVDYDNNTPIFQSYEYMCAVGFDSDVSALNRLKDLIIDTRINSLNAYRIVEWIIID